MSLENEGKPLALKENAQSTFTAKAIEEITSDLRGEKLESARFQAFADYADHLVADEQVRSSPESTLFLIRYSLIQETKRRRNNGLQGYKKAYEDAEDLG